MTTAATCINSIKEAIKCVTNREDYLSIAVRLHCTTDYLNVVDLPHITIWNNPNSYNFQKSYTYLEVTKTIKTSCKKKSSFELIEFLYLICDAIIVFAFAENVKEVMDEICNYLDNIMTLLG